MTPPGQPKIPIGPRTDREKLIAEAAHLQGYAEGFADASDGVQKLAARLRTRDLNALADLESSK